MRYKYSHAILGGTFDHLHAGHKYFIKTSFNNSDKIIIGLTIDEFSRNKPLAYSIENYKTRKKSLENFLSENKYIGRSNIVEINDPYGTSLTDKSIDAIFVTSHGLPNAKIINQKRASLGLSKLVINKISFLRGPDKKIISSTRIRAGEINRQGTPYLRLFNQTLHLPESLRSDVKNAPSGKLLQIDGEFQSLLNEHFIIAVGDVVTKVLKQKKRPANVSVLDYKIERKNIGKNRSKIGVLNSPGTINKRAVLVLQKAIKNALRGENQRVEISGEEDLLALPATLLAPLGSSVIYGMPGKGAIVVEVTEEKKEEVEKFLKKFNSLNS